MIVRAVTGWPLSCAIGMRALRLALQTHDAPRSMIVEAVRAERQALVAY